MSWILLGVLILVAVIALGAGAILMAGLGLAISAGLVAHVLMGDADIDGRRDT